MKSRLSRILFNIACGFLNWSHQLDADYGYDAEPLESDYYGPDDYKVGP